MPKIDGINPKKKSDKGNLIRRKYVKKGLPSLSPAAITEEAKRESSGYGNILKPSDNKETKDPSPKYPVDEIGYNPNYKRSAKKRLEQRLRQDERFQKAAEIYDLTQYSKQELENKLVGKMNGVSFPNKLMALAILKDLADAATGSILAIIFSILFGIFLFFWVRAKVGWGRRMLFKQVARWVAILIADSIPGLSFIPFTVVLVFLVHNQHTKTVQFLISGYEAIKEHELSITKYLERINQNSY